MNIMNDAVKRFLESIDKFNKNSSNISLKIYEDLRKTQLKQFSTRELMNELRRRGKTVGKKE